MGFLERLKAAKATLFRAEAGGSPLSPSADFWYGNPGYMSDAGVRISPDTAMRLAAVYACVRVISETVASLPLIIYRRLPDGGKERATDHPLYEVLHDDPNEHQTSYDFIQMMQGHLELRGNAFALIIPGPRGAVDQLLPLHPDRVQVFRLPSGRLQYSVQDWWTGTLNRYAQEEIFHLRGLSSNGITGMSTIALASEVVGSGLAQQEYANRFLANDSKPSGVLEHPNKLSKEGYDRVKSSWQEAQTGSNRHKVTLLEEGMKYTAIALSNKDSQFIEARQMTRGDIASIFRIPPHKIGDLSRATFSNIEQQAIEFVTDSLRSRLVAWERRITKDLIDTTDYQEVGVPDRDEYFVEFLVDALLRGDQKSRYEAYASALGNGSTPSWLSVNEVREMENRNRIVGGDAYWVPLNMTQAGTIGPDPTDSTPAEDATANTALRMKEFIQAAAERSVRKEARALRKLVDKPDAQEQTAKFYESHAQFIIETMHISKTAADAYVDAHQKILKASQSFAAMVDYIEETGADVLTDLAMGEKQ